MAKSTNSKAEMTAKATNDKNEREYSPAHIYEEINQVSANGSKTGEDGSKNLKDEEVIFDIADIHTQPPAYQTFTMPTCGKKSTSRKSNNYHIEGKEMDLNKENIGEKC